MSVESVTSNMNALFCDENSHGALASNLPGHRDEVFYITTAIAYMNGLPHIGHAYEFLSTDVVARYHRALGFDTYFLTGSDEHGQKVAASAELTGKTPLDHCNYYVDIFQKLMTQLAITNNDFQRTTDPFHHETAQALWKRCFDNDDIFLDSYEGWYNEREETYVTESEAELNNFCDPDSGVPLKKVKEASYFFRMSKFCDRLLTHIEDNPDFIQPEQFRNGIVARLKKEGLKDLSISRTSFRWGIPMGEGFDPAHVMYVWFDALTNYITGCHLLGEGHPLSKYWTNTRHVIGKDIVWFHCVIWPCMLMSAGLPLPAGVFSHGFVNASDGRKMSKSFGNTIDPIEILNKYPCDSIRYFFTASVTYGSDISFSEQALVTMHNSELADVIGNLVHRILNLAQKYCGGVIPAVNHDPSFSQPFDLAALIANVTDNMNSFAIHTAVGHAMEAARATNRFLTEAEPWKMKGADEGRRPAIVRTTLEAIYAFMHFLGPVIPFAAQKVFSRLNTSPIVVSSLRPDFYNLVPGTAVNLGDILFQKIEYIPPVPAATSSSTEVPTPAAKVNKYKKDGGDAAGKDKKKTAKQSQDALAESLNQHDFSKIELKVGRIEKVWNHPTADRLFCEEIRLGDDQVVNVCSGLRGSYTLEEMQDRLVVVVCNLKESKMQGFVSQGMVLAAKISTDEEGGTHVVLLEPPAATTVGERVCLEAKKGVTTPLEGLNPLAPCWSATRVKKQKIWEAVAGELRTDDAGIACWKGEYKLATSAGACTVPLSHVNTPLS